MRVILITLLLLASTQARAATVHFGFGQAKANIAAAFVGANNGDDFIAHGPLTENNQAVTWALLNCTLTVVGGDYVFDGTGATLDGIKITGTGNTFDFLGADGSQMSFTGYGRFVFWVSAASNTVNDPYVYDNGYAVAGNCYNFMLYANSTYNRPVLASALDNNARHYGMYINASGGGAVNDLSIANVVVTGGASRFYGVQSLGACGAVVVDGVTISNCSAAGVSWGMYWAGTGAGDVMQARRVHIDSVTSAGTTQVMYAAQVAMDLQNFVIENCDGDAIYIASTTGFAGGTHQIANGVIYGAGDDGVYANSDVAGSQLTVRNVIARNCTGIGFSSASTFDPDSDNNLAYSNGTDWNSWIAGADDLTVDPQHVDAAGGDYHLFVDSPCIDAGAWITGRTTDIDGNPMSGPEMDIGPYEFQQQSGRTIRMQVTSPVRVPTRNVRSAR